MLFPITSPSAYLWLTGVNFVATAGSVSLSQTLSSSEYRTMYIAHHWNFTFYLYSEQININDCFLPCINSKSLLTTVLRNFQWALRKRGYCPTMYIMLEAMMALLSFPLFCSHRPSRSWNKQANMQSISIIFTYVQACDRYYSQWCSCGCSGLNTLMTVTRNLFSSSSCMAPLIDPMAQHNVFRFFQDHSVPLTWLWSFSVIMRSVSA